MDTLTETISTINETALKAIGTFQEQVLACWHWAVEGAPRACHSVRALVEEVVRAVTVAEVIEPPRFSLGRGAALDRVLVDQHLDRADVPAEVAGVGVRLGQLRRARSSRTAASRPASGGRAIPGARRASSAPWR